MLIKHPKSMLSDVNSLSLPMLNSYYTEQNMQNGINPVYVQNKFLKPDTNKYPILVSISYWAGTFVFK
jgi:hypothetical protein